MKQTKIGNWIITENHIKWNGSYGNFEYSIQKNNLLEIIDNNYYILIHVSSKTWLKIEDVYALNSAFLLSIDINQQSKFNLQVFIETLKYQNSLINK